MDSEINLGSTSSLPAFLDRALLVNERKVTSLQSENGTATPSSQPPGLPLWVLPVLALPALIPLARAYITAYLKGRVPTGFVQYDMACYMANAREHFDNGFQLLYGNPYASYQTPAIYFQPHIFVLGVLQRVGLDPGVAFNLFGLAALFLSLIHI